MLSELGIVFYQDVCFAKLAPFPIFGCTTKVARVCQRNVERDFRIYTKVYLLLQKRTGKTLSREGSNHIPFGNDGKTLFANIVGIHAKTYTTRSLVFLHLYVGEIPTKRLPFGKRARFWFVGRKMYSRVQSAKHNDPGDLSLERIPIRQVLVFYYKYIAIQTNR